MKKRRKKPHIASHHRYVIGCLDFVVGIPIIETAAIATVNVTSLKTRIRSSILVQYVSTCAICLGYATTWLQQVSSTQIWGKRRRAAEGEGSISAEPSAQP